MVTFSLGLLLGGGSELLFGGFVLVPALLDVLEFPLHAAKTEVNNIIAKMAEKKRFMHLTSLIFVYSYL